MANCRYKIGSITLANKAKQMLATHNIFVKIIKISASADNGCTHGIEFNCAQKSNVAHLLLRESINFEEYVK